MRAFVFFGSWALVICSLISQAQSDLHGLSNDRSNYFTEQQSKVQAYAASHNQPIAFTDDKGNSLFMMGLSPNGFPIYLTTLNALAAVTTNLIPLRAGGSAGLDLQGKGMLIGIWDGGPAKSHIELGQRVISKEGSSFDNHATHVTGTLIATGIDQAAKGMAPLAEAVSLDFQNDEAEMAALAAPGTALLLSNHSYGNLTGWYKSNNIWYWSGDPIVNAIEDYRFGFYDVRARTIDQIASMAPYYTIVWAAGNDRADAGDGSRPADCNGGSGYDCIIPEGVSKNIITVGAVNRVISYTNPFDVSMSFFSSWGPTDDGRIKPDLVGDGVGLYSLSATGTDTYTTMSGTSMSTPNVAGSLMLIQELYGKLHAGTFMKASTMKALAIHTTREAGNFPGPDYSFGWGLLDATAASKILLNQDAENVFVKELSLMNDSSFHMRLHPKVNQKITATIAWTDPPGTPLSPSLDPNQLMLVNDLDIRIVDDQGREQLPWALDPSNPSKQAVRSDNFRDNVEKLEFDFPEGKDYTLVVRHKRDLAGGKQDFSLILSYQSTKPGKTLYWVGDEGVWSDGSHWALTSGGASSFQIPGAADRVIVDENSFDGTGTDAIALSLDATCSSLLWINSKPSGFSLNDHVINVGAKCIIATPNFFVQTKGTIHLAGNAAGNFVAGNSNLANATLLVDGNWNLNGNFFVDEIQSNSGVLNVLESKVSVWRFIANSALTKNIYFDNSEIHVKVFSEVGNSTIFTSNHSSFVIDSTNVNFQWQAVNFPGQIKIGAGLTVSLNGNNHIGHLNVQGKVLLNGSNQFDSLVLEAGAELDVAASTVQTLGSQISGTGNSVQPITMQSPGHATLSFAEHARICFDYVKIANLDVAGVAVVNAGLNSVVVNSNHWQQKSCGDLLFADFEDQYPCANGLTFFSNKSSGADLTYTWQFGTSGPTSADSNPTFKFTEPGSYPVLLVVADQTSFDSVMKHVEIVPNTLGPNHIFANAGVLTSFSKAGNYQWFENGLPIAGETGRTYSLHNSDGALFVVTYDGQCNLVSDTITIASVKGEGLDVFPNPANDYLKVEVPTGSNPTISLVDFTGRTVLQRLPVPGEIVLSTQALPNGLYILQISDGTDGGRREKIVIRH